MINKLWKIYVTVGMATFTVSGTIGLARYLDNALLAIVWVMVCLWGFNWLVTYDMATQVKKGILKRRRKDV